MKLACCVELIRIPIRKSWRIGSLYLSRNIVNALHALLAAVLFCIAAPDAAQAVGIKSTKHNLSVSGPGPIKAVSETRICVFCHTPHSATVSYFMEPGLSYPLWNHKLQLPSVTYILPGQLQGTPLLSTPQNPPDGDSRLCLSCHDGTVAIGAVVNLGNGSGTGGSNIAMTGTGLTMEGKLDLAQSAFVGADLDMSGHHPVSIVVNQDLVADLLSRCEPSSFTVRLEPVRPVIYRPTLDVYPESGGSSGNGVQCTSCHDPHDDMGGKKFLRIGSPDNAQPLCDSCHMLCP